MGRRVRAGGLPGGWWGSLSLRRRRTAASMASLPHRIPAAPDIDIKSSITQLVPIPRATVRTEPHLSLLPPSPQATNDLTIQSSPFHCGASRCPGKKKKKKEKKEKKFSLFVPRPPPISALVLFSPKSRTATVLLS